MRGASSKVCTICGIEKPLEQFRMVGGKRIARRTDCKECETAYKSGSDYKRRQSEYSRNRRSDPIHRQNGIEQSRAYGKTVWGRATRLWLAAKQRAKTNNIEFTISKDYIAVILTMGVCQRTGIPFDFSAPPEGKAFNPYAPSIDKRNPFGGYTYDNVQIVCNTYNIAKHQLTDEQFVEFCKLVVNKNA